MQWPGGTQSPLIDQRAGEADRRHILAAEEAQAEGHVQVDDAGDDTGPDGSAHAGGGVQAGQAPEQRAALPPRDERSQTQLDPDKAALLQ